MNVEYLDDLPNINKNIQSFLESSNPKEDPDELDIKQITEKFCTENIDKVSNNLSENNTNLINSITNKSKEIEGNIDKFINKLEKETNDHITNIEKFNLSEKEKQEQYLKCIEQLDNIISLNQGLENCIELSEENLLSYLGAENFENPIFSFLNDKEDKLNKSNIFMNINSKQELSEEIYNNNISSNYIKNYVVNPFNEGIKLKELKIDNNSDIAMIKQLLMNKDDKNQFIQDQIRKISIRNISKEGLQYLFLYKMKKALKDHEKEVKKKNKNKKIEEEFTVIDKKKPNNIEEEEKEETLDTYNKFKSISIKNSNVTDIDLKEMFPEIETLKLSSCQISYELYNYIEKDSFNNLTEIYLDGCNLINENFSEIIFQIMNKEVLRKNLKLLSAKNNKLNQLNFHQYFPQEMRDIREKYPFDNLELLDFSYNKIYTFNYMLFYGTPKLKIIDLSNNSFQVPKDWTNLMKFYSSTIRKLKENKEKKEEKKADEKKPDENKSVEEEKQKQKEKEGNKENNEEAKKTEELNDNKENEKYKKSDTGKIKDNSQMVNEENNLHEAKTFANVQTPKEETKQEKKKREDFAIFMSGNITLLRDNNMETYLNYLFKILPLVNYPLKRINLSHLFYNTKYHARLFDINLANFKNSLTEINLSSCNITDNEINKLLLNQFFLVNIRKINISNNRITDKIFELLKESKLYDIYHKLKIIDLSNNEIYLNKGDEVKKFAQLFDSIHSLIIRNTPAEENINYFIKTIIIKFNEDKNGEQKKTEFDQNELLAKDLIDNKEEKENLYNKSHIKLKMKCLIDYKFVEFAQIIYPKIFERIDIEYKI